MGGGAGLGLFKNTIQMHETSALADGTLYAAAKKKAAPAAKAGDGTGNDAGKKGTVMGMGAAPPDPPEKYEDLPIIEKLCAQADALKADPVLMSQIKDLHRRSEETGLEHGGWIVKNPSGGYSIPTIVVGTKKEIDPGDPPPNAVGSVHTHPHKITTKPSLDDQYHAANEKRKVDINITLGGTGDASFLDNTGRQFRCEKLFNWFVK